MTPSKAPYMTEATNTTLGPKSVKRHVPIWKQVPLPQPLRKLRNFYKRNISRILFRRPIAIETDRPLISFTFDDFPRTALLAGGRILARHGAAGTYYTSLGLLGTDGPSGPHFTREDLKALLAEGHELGCHTYAHLHSWGTLTEDFENSVLENRSALAELVPSAHFKTFSFPISEPRPFTKLKTARHFLCCRGGGQTLNSGTADLDRLAAFFLEKSRDDIDAVKRLIDRNRIERGWLIFATHDVADNPGPYGCTPRFFEEVVEYAVKSGAAILPVTQALNVLEGCDPAHRND